MWKKIFDSSNDWKLTLARLALGVVIFPHGAQKLLGWFGGYGYAGTMGFFTETLGIPAPLAFLVILVEFFGGLALIVGALARPAALGIGVIMVTAALLVHLPNGFFMNWSGAQGGEGFEFHILAAALALVVTIGGAGALSLDRALATAGSAGDAAAEVPAERRELRNAA
ncbi:MAG TPA: DoxX family protein [Desulfurivibrionaceae bacterium]|nr:DoxX family protein [Desulfurivibrionaceae bacterium]